jgi:predicted amidophosphoribosyltransferase
MPTVAELSAPYGNFMFGPRRGRDVCSICFNLTDGYARCYGCVHGGRWLDAMAPISYSVAGEQLHHALASYKRLNGEVGRRFALGLAAVLWRHLGTHERCLAQAAGVDSFALVTTVPSSARERERGHPLPKLVASLVGPARDRYELVLRRSEAPAAAHQFSVEKFEPLRDLSGESVLLIDDTWTTGANAQSAAAALKAAGAGAVAALVIGRYVNREWRHNDRHLRGLPQPFDWGACALCAQQEAPPATHAEPD